MRVQRRNHWSDQRLPEAIAKSNEKPTFVYEVNGASFANLINGPRSYEDNVQRMVSLLGKSNRSTFSLSRLPDGQDMWEVTRESLPSVFLQAAGTADAMTIEWRRVEVDGAERLYAVGHGGPRDGEPPVTIDFLEGTARALVYPDEVFAADEAGEMFVHYLHTLTVPDRYTLRELNLATPAP